jgi:murein DD-endopeptidase MepM/ murein hydrolase activator NlpD
VLRRRTLWMKLLATGAVLAGLAAIPTAAAADTCTISVTLLGGQVLKFTINVAAGTPLSSIQLPLSGKVASLSESCASATPTTTTTTGTTSTVTGTTTGSSTGTTTTTAAATTTTGTQTAAAPSTVSVKQQKQTSAKLPSTWGKTTTTPVTKLTNSNGTPAADNPTASFALPGAAPVGVPNFFIDSFQIPPFLLPIYQAAGIEYDVPWQVLAAINWIETDYGRDLNVSSAGAVGWMQFLPSTWKKYGVDATGSGYADPFNPTDAIFAAARYLAAAGAAKDLSKAIYAYNHAGWYVNSVLLRAQLIGGMPSSLIGALTGLVEGHFPVAAKASYADDSVDKLAGKKVTGLNAAIPVESTAATGTAIFAKTGSPVVAVNDGKVVKIGDSSKLGKYVVLQDETGNTYTYSDLGSIPALYPVPKPVKITAGQLAKELQVPTPTTTGATTTGTATTATTVAPTQAASAGSQPAVKAAKVATGKVTKALSSHTKTSSSPLSLLLDKPAKIASPITTAGSTKKKAASAPAGQAKERLFANPANPKSYAAGGKQQLASEASEITDFQNYFSDALHLARNQYTLAPLQKGSIVTAGTILGRIGKSTPAVAATATTAAIPAVASHLWFQIQPAGRNAPYIDPKPILDGWKLLEATAVYRADGINPFFGPSAKQATVGQILLESKAQLQARVLADPHVSIYACGRRDVQAGAIDRRILAAIEFLSVSGLDPTISGLECGAGQNGVDAAGRTGSSMDISAINNIPIAGHQGAGSITDITIRRLLTLQGAMQPADIISDMSYKGQSNTLSLPDHTNRIQVSYTPAYGTNRKLSGEVKSLLKPAQWIQLIDRIGQIPEPSVPTRPSAYAIKTSSTG